MLPQAQRGQTANSPQAGEQVPWDQTSGFNPLSETSWVVRRGFSGCNHKMEVGSPGFEKDASYHLPFCVAPARRRRLSSLGEPRKRKGWLSTHRRLFPRPGMEKYITSSQTPSARSWVLPSHLQRCRHRVSSRAREDGEGSRVTAPSFTERRDRTLV